MKRKLFIFVGILASITLCLIYGNIQSHKNKLAEVSVLSPEGLRIEYENHSGLKYMEESGNDKLAFLKIKLENEGEKEIQTGAIDFEAKLSNGKVLSPSSEYDGFYSVFKPGDRKYENLIFKVPETEKIVRLYYHGESNNSVRMNVK